MDIFAQASLNKVRFPELGKGSISSEDLWSMGEEVLIQVATELDVQIDKAGGNNKYRRGKSTASSMLILKRDILAFVIAWKYDQKDASRTAAIESAEEREFLDLIHAKELEEKAAKPLSELKAEYNARFAKK